VAKVSVGATFSSNRDWILGCLIIIPLLSASAQNSIAGNSVWSIVQKYQIPIVAIGLLVAIVDVVQSSHSGHSKHRGNPKNRLTM